ncbi:ras-like protein rasZ isoform X2 [Varroa jacobsoni]|nr:ras-like protein rasZ isoform X2 [Varroa jacobsoni]
MLEAKQRVRITVLGPRKAGKTALVFRYMARLFVATDRGGNNATGASSGSSSSDSSSSSDNKNSSSRSYSGALDNLYYHCVCLDNVLYDLEILDLAQSKNVLKFERCSDAFIVVYSVALRSDFEEAVLLCNRLRAIYPRKPLLLVGNKTDLTRQVTTSEGQKVGGVLFAEVSVAHVGSWEVHQAMYRLLRRVSEIRAEQAASNKCHFVVQNAEEAFGRRDSMDTSSA